MAEQAIVTLTALTPNITPSKRVLRLNADRLSAPIGRASKSVTKGLIAAVDNAWFDNPVMSRDHAELVLRLEDMTVLIQDVQSMHGTKVNDIKLPTNTPRAIQTGDILSFGAEVRRGPDTFPPCRFRIECELGPWRLEHSRSPEELILPESANSLTRSRGFQFPDSSDVEDELEQSLDGDEDFGEVREDELTPIESPVLRNSTSAEAIDLTEEESEPAHDSPQNMSTSQADLQSVGQLENPIVLEGEYDTEDADDVDSDEESQVQDYEDSEGGSEDDSDKENNEDSDENSEIIVGAHTGYDSDSSEGSRLDDIEHKDYSLSTAVGPQASQAYMFSDNKDIPISNLRTTAQGSMGDAMRNIMFRSQHGDSAGEAVQSKYAVDDRSQDNSAEEPLAAISKIAGSNATSEELASYSFNGSNTQLGCAHPPPNSFWPHIFEQGASTDRLPSPSDAAMAKSTSQGPGETSVICDTSSSQTINPAKIQQIPLKMWNPFACHPLGDKSGKQDFFEAREVNRARVYPEESRFAQPGTALDGMVRAKFNQLGHPYNPRPTYDQAQVTSSQPTNALHGQPNVEQIAHQRTDYTPRLFLEPLQSHTQRQLQILMAQKQAQLHAQSEALRVEREKYQEEAREEARTLARTAAGIPFPEIAPLPPLHPVSRPESPIGIRAPSPELDMTSAAIFNKSKTSASVQNASAVPSRSAVRINDIVEPQAIQVTESVTTSTKRKSDDISDVLEEEVRVWASKDASIMTREASIHPDVEIVVTQAPTQENTAAPALPVTSEAAPDNRAVKKLKRVAEALGYTALGSVALFSVLVATAPEFL